MKRLVLVTSFRDSAEWGAWCSKFKINSDVKEFSVGVSGVNSLTLRVCNGFISNNNDVLTPTGCRAIVDKLCLILTQEISPETTIGVHLGGGITLKGFLGAAHNMEVDIRFLESAFNHLGKANLGEYTADGDYVKFVEHWADNLRGLHIKVSLGRWTTAIKHTVGAIFLPVDIDLQKLNEIKENGEQIKHLTWMVCGAHAPVTGYFAKLLDLRAALFKSNGFLSVVKKAHCLSDGEFKYFIGLLCCLSGGVVNKSDLADIDATSPIVVFLKKLDGLQCGTISGPDVVSLLNFFATVDSGKPWTIPSKDQLVVLRSFYDWFSCLMHVLGGLRDRVEAVTSLY